MLPNTEPVKKRAYKIDKAIKECRTLRGEIYSCYRMLREKSLTQEWMNDYHKKLYASERYQRLPGWAQSQIRGYLDCCFDTLWNRDLVHVNRYKDGSTYPVPSAITGKATPPGYQERPEDFSFADNPLVSSKRVWVHSGIDFDKEA